MANIIKIKRGLSSNISNISLQEGEIACTTDDGGLYIGTSSGNKQIANDYNELINKPSSVNIIEASSETEALALSQQNPNNIYYWSE